MLRYSLRTLLIAMTFVSICIGGIVHYTNLLNPEQFKYLAITLVWCAPLWLPIAFASYAIGRRTLTVACVVAFALANAASAGIIQWWILKN